MKLSIADRIQFHVLLPQKGDFLSMTLKQSIIEKVKITTDEIEEIGLKTTDRDVYSWDSEKAKDKEVEFTESEIVLINSTLEDLEKKKELDDVTYSFYKKFKQN